MEANAVRPGDRADLGDGLDRADLVVGGHDGDERGFGRNGLFHVGGAHLAVFVYGQVGHLEALALELLTGVQDGVVLDRAGNDVVALRLERIGAAAHGPVIGLGAAAGEVDLVGFGVQRGGHLGAGLVEQAARVAAKGVDARGVAVHSGQAGHHGLQHGLGDAGCGGVVHINAVHELYRPFRLLRFMYEPYLRRDYGSRSQVFPECGCVIQEIGI